MFQRNRVIGALLGVAAASATLAGCSKRGSNEKTSGGSIDTAVLKTGSVSPAAGPGVQVTRTDSKSVQRSMQFEITPENFGRFLAAADSLAALVARDPTARAFLANNLTDAGSTEPDAGLKWLESNEVVARTIDNQRISVKDYFVMAIAIASAERFINSPEAAPPTPTATKNAKFLAEHKADVAHLHSLRDGKPGVTITPP